MNTKLVSDYGKVMNGLAKQTNLLSAILNIPNDSSFSIYAMRPFVDDSIAFVVKDSFEQLLVGTDKLDNGNISYECKIKQVYPALPDGVVLFADGEECHRWIEERAVSENADNPKMLNEWRLEAAQDMIMDFEEDMEY